MLCCSLLVLKDSVWPPSVSLLVLYHTYHINAVLFLACFEGQCLATKCITVGSNINWTTRVLVVININRSHCHGSLSVGSVIQHRLSCVIKESSEGKLIESVIGTIAVFLVDDVLVCP